VRYEKIESFDVYSLSNVYTSNYLNHTVFIQVIVEGELTCFIKKVS